MNELEKYIHRAILNATYGCPRCGPSFWFDDGRCCICGMLRDAEGPPPRRQIRGLLSPCDHHWTRLGPFENPLAVEYCDWCGAQRTNILEETVYNDSLAVYDETNTATTLSDNDKETTT